MSYQWLSLCRPLELSVRIRGLSVRNFRSIRELSLECGELVTLVGPNNHGKSNILAALEFALSTASKPSLDDFFAHREAGDDALWVEVSFCDLTEQEQITFKRYVLSSGTVRIRKTASISDGVVKVGYNGWIEEPNEAWLKSENAGSYTRRDAVNATPLADLVSSSGRLGKADLESAQAAYIESHRDEIEFETVLESGPLLGQKNVGGGVLPEIFLIPAVRDLTEEIKVKSNTTFGRLLNRAVRDMAERDERFIEARAQLENVVETLNQRAEGTTESNELAALEASIEQELKAWGVKVDIEVTPPELEKIFELGTDVQLFDGVRTSADRKGHGLQRAMIFALIRSWAAALRREWDLQDEAELRARSKSNSVIFAMEEPELFLHPHAQRRLSSSLRGIAGTPEHQVFLCTHSTHFVELDHYKEIAIISKSDPAIGSTVRQCTDELFEGEDIAARKRRFQMAQWINPYRGEMFFARRAVFVEGETERVALPFLARALDLYDPEVSIIDCGSKHNLPLYIAIANAFQIPFVVVHDEDPIPDPIPEDWNEDKRRAKQRTFDLNAQIDQSVDPPLGRVEMARPDFERAAGVSKSQGEKKGKALAALEYFQDKAVDQIPADLKSIIQTAYAQV